MLLKILRHVYLSEDKVHLLEEHIKSNAKAAKPVVEVRTVYYRTFGLVI